MTQNSSQKSSIFFLHRENDLRTDDAKIDIMSKIVVSTQLMPA